MSSNLIFNNYLGDRRRLDIARATLSAVRLVKNALENAADFADFKSKMTAIETDVFNELSAMETKAKAEIIKRYNYRISAKIGDSLNEDCEKTVD